MGWTAAMLEYFGAGNKSKVQFAKEELSPMPYSMRQEFHKMLSDAGVKCDPPAAPQSTTEAVPS